MHRALMRGALLGAVALLPVVALPSPATAEQYLGYAVSSDPRTPGDCTVTPLLISGGWLTVAITAEGASTYPGTASTRVACEISTGGYVVRTLPGNASVANGTAVIPLAPFTTCIRVTAHMVDGTDKGGNLDCR
jgi:hypothetical protein